MKIEKEFKDIGNFINVESADKTNKFNVLYNLDTKKYYKVYNKRLFIEKTMTGSDTGEVYNILLPFFKKKTTFLPELHYETKNYLFFDYYIDYSLPKASDFIDISKVSLYKILNIPNENADNNFKPTVLFNEIINSFEKIYLNEKIYDPIPEDIKKMYALIFNNNTNNNKLNYLTITPSNISLKDFVVKRNENGEILDWKYIDMENLHIQPPKYIYNLNENDKYPINYIDPNFTKSDAYKRGGHDAVNNEQVLHLLENNNIIYCFESKWYTI